MRIMRCRWRLLAAAFAAMSCSRTPRTVPLASGEADARIAADELRIDSLTIDHGACFGACPVYHMIVRRDGSVDLRQGSPPRRQMIDAERARSLLDQASASGLLTLPSQIRADPQLCPVAATDQSNVTLTAFGAGMVHRVQHYTGCYVEATSPRIAERLLRLVSLETRIDALERDLNDGAAGRRP
jgi:hypothetical protein